MLLWMPYNIETDKGFDFSTAMDIFWICDLFTIGGCILTLFSLYQKEKKIQLTAMILLFVGAFLCIIGGAIDSDEWCTTFYTDTFTDSYMDECVAYIVFMYCLFIPFCIGYVILLILYRSQYTFSNLIFMRSKRIIYLMFVSALMIIPVVIMIKWYFQHIDFEWKAYWISIILFDVFTWIIALFYGFSGSERGKQRRVNGNDGFTMYHPLCIGTIAIIWIASFISTLLWGLIGYTQYKYDTDDLLARYADYILMVSVNLWIMGEVLTEDEGYIDIDMEIDYQSVPQSNPIDDVLL